MPKMNVEPLLPSKKIIIIPLEKVAFVYYIRENIFCPLYYLQGV